MQAALLLLLSAASLLVSEATIAFTFINGFQTKTSTDKYCLTFTATSDTGSSVNQGTYCANFGQSVNVTVANANKYMTNFKASLSTYNQYGAGAVVASVAPDSTEKYFSNNFVLVASTQSYDAFSGANVPKLTVLQGSSDPYTASVVVADFFYNTYGYTDTFYGPTTYYVYYFPYNQLKTYIYPSSSYSMSTGSTRLWTAQDTKSWIYINGGSASYKFCTNNACATAESPAYAGTGQTFFVIYSGNQMYSTTGKINFSLPPNTLVVN